jgi:hypothetical protein
MPTHQSPSKATPPDPHPSKMAAPAPAPEPDPHSPSNDGRLSTPYVRTIADEQRERSEELQDKGVETAKAEQDERDPADKPRQVAGVSNLEGGTPGRSTPPARAAQNKAAP